MYCKPKISLFKKILFDTDAEALRDLVSQPDEQMRKVQALLEKLAKDRSTEDAPRF